MSRTGDGPCGAASGGLVSLVGITLWWYVLCSTCTVLSAYRVSSSSGQLTDTIGAALQLIATESVTLSPRTVTTKYGSVRGSLVRLNVRRSHSSPSSQVPQTDLPEIETYLGVPYATPPTGALRFMPPVTPTHWRGVRLANRLKPVCPQRISSSQLMATRANRTEALKRMPRARYEYLRRLVPLLGNQSEDCLYLNIYTPNVRSTTVSGSGNNQRASQVPVIVFLHGESYEWQSGNIFDASILASYGQVLVVTLNFRLGVIGFLPAFVDGTVRGNYGLMDQVAALHWIQENIAEFGGSPTNVTLVGHGYGAACAHLLMLSPMAKGLFTRVVLMSGSALSPWAIAREPEYYSRLLGEKLNCTNLETMVDCLRAHKVTELTGVELDVPDHLTSFGPIIDSIVVPLDPRALYHAALYAHTQPDKSQNQTSQLLDVSEQLQLARSYDLLLGATDIDSPCMFSEEEAQQGIEAARRDRIIRTLVRNLYDYHQQAIFLTLFNEYSGWSAPRNERSLEALESTVSILSDSLVMAPLLQTADLHSTQRGAFYRRRRDTKHWVNYADDASARVFVYRFDTNQALQAPSSHHSYESDSSGERLVCPISHDLAYLFGDPIAHLQLGLTAQTGPFYYPTNLTRNHLLISEYFIQFIVNFVRSGDPNVRSGHSSKVQYSSNKLNPSSTQRFFWPQYEPKQKSYLAFGSASPKSQDYRQSHRLSLWLNLIPRLLMDEREFYLTNLGQNLSNHWRLPLNKIKSTSGSITGSGRVGGRAESSSRHIAGSLAMASEPYSQQQQQQLYRQHHLLLDYENHKSFEGVVRTHWANQSLIAGPLESESNASPNATKMESVSSQMSGNTNESWPAGMAINATQSAINLTSHVSDSTTRQGTGGPVQESRHETEATSFLLANHAGLSNALLITVGIGCALLVFNVLIFAALYYQLDKNRKLVAAQQKIQSDSNQKDSTNIQSIQLNQSKSEMTSSPIVKFREPNDLNPELLLMGSQLNTNSMSRSGKGGRNATGNFAPYTVYPPSDLLGGHQMSSETQFANGTLESHKSKPLGYDELAESGGFSQQWGSEGSATVVVSSTAPTYVPFVPASQAYYCLQVQPTTTGPHTFEPDHSKPTPSAQPTSATTTNPTGQYREMSV